MPSLRNYKFAFETVTWGRRILDLDAVLSGLSACGYEGVEFAQAPDQILIVERNQYSGKPIRSRPVKDIAELLRKLRDHGLKLVSLAGGRLQERVDFCESYRPPYLYIDHWDASAEQIASGDSPFTLGLHPHWFLAVQSGRYAREIIEKRCREIPGQNTLKLLPDTAHLTIVGERPAEAVSDPNFPLAAVHLKDWVPNYGRYSRRYAQGFTHLGAGVVKIEEVLTALDRSGFDGWVVVEQDTSENTPLQSAEKCARWLKEKGYLEIPDERRLLQALEAESTYPVPKLSQESQLRNARILNSILPATTTGPANFHQSVTDALLKEMPKVLAVQYFNYSSRNDELYLLAISGVPGYRPVTVINAASGCCLSNVTREQKFRQKEFQKPPSPEHFHDPELIKAAGACHLVVVPVFNSSNSHHLDHLLCFYCASPGALGTEEELAHLGTLIARAADSMADDCCSASATRTSWISAESKSRDEFLKKLHDVFLEQLLCEGCSIFLADINGKRLKPDYAPELAWKENVPAHKRYYEKGQGLTGTVWENGEMLLLSGRPWCLERWKVLRTDRSQDDRRSVDRDECLMGPITRSGAIVRGVVRVVNKKPFPGHRGATVFTDDDAAVVEAIIVTALPHLELLSVQAQQKEAVSRMVHEFQTPLVGIRASVDRIQTEFKEQGWEPEKFFNHDYLNDISQNAQLMGKLALNAQVYTGQPPKPVKVKTLLLGDVIGPSRAHVKPLQKRSVSYNIEPVDFHKIPDLWIDRNQMQQVFYNLLSNSFKYGVRDGRVDIRITASRPPNGYLIRYEDDGQGISEGLDEEIFEPGFREEHARFSNVSGQGYGLAVVRSLVEVIGGTIKLSRNEDSSAFGRPKPSIFEIFLPNSLGVPQPQVKQHFHI